MKRLLFIAHRMPFPPDKGERVRAFNQIKALSSHFDLTLATLAHNSQDVQSAQALHAYCGKVLFTSMDRRVGLARGCWNLLTTRSVTEGFFHSPALHQLVAEETRRHPFDLAMGYSSGMLPYLRTSRCPAQIMDLVDVDSAKWASYAQSSRSILRPLYRQEARRVRQLEQQAIRSCQAVLLVSHNEAQSLGEDQGRITVIGNGVDVEYFSPAHSPSAKTPCLVFTGSMDYRPNVQGVCWFAHTVWPALRQAHPDLNLTVVGRNPAPAVRGLEGMPGITVTGAVPDVRPFLHSQSIAVVPLQIARGIQNKVLEAMAMARPVVASPQALTGLSVSVGSEVLQAHEVGSWLKIIPSLLADPERMRTLGQAARRRVESDYTWPVQMAPLVSLCCRLCQDPATPPGREGA